VLFGREREQWLLDTVLDKARGGTAAALVLRGEPGIGKTALLGLAKARADGMSVVRARGVEVESDVAFAALAEVLRPFLEHLDAIPVPQAAALSGALALGPAVPGDPFTTSAATLSLLAAAAERAPLLVLVDDAHWLDSSSATALLFAARRSHAEGIAFLFAARDEEPRPFDAEGVEELRVEGLDPDASRALLGRAAGDGLDPSVAARLLDLAGGNPLALLEVPAGLRPAQLAGTEPLDEPVPVGRKLERTYLERVARLPEMTRTALLVAASSSGRMSEIAPALAQLGIGPDVFEPAESGGLVAIADGVLVFRHPLLTSAVYHGGSASDRRKTHQALAEATTGETRAWHLAAAATGPDEAVADALEEAGANARGRGAHAIAATAYERASTLSGDEDRRVARAIEAARDFQLAGRLDRSKRLLEEALAAARNGSHRAEIQHLRGRGEMLGGAPMEAYELLVREAERIERQDADKAVMMLAEASGSASFAGNAAATLEAAQRAQAIAARVGGPSQLVAAVFLAWALVLVGRGPQAREILARYEDALAQVEPLAAAVLIQYAAASLTALEQVGRARHLVRRLVASARTAGAPGAVAFPLSLLADFDFRTGRWDSSYAHASEAATLATETGQANILSWALTRLAAVDAGRGRRTECREHMVAGLEIESRLGNSGIKGHAGAFLGLLALGSGDTEEAIGELESVTRFERERGVVEPALISPYGADLTEAYLRVGRRDDALRTLSEFTDRAQATERKIAFATAARCRGLLAADNEFDVEFREALARHAETDVPFERARTLLCFGERLRRAGRRRDARERLREAHAIFQELGAEPWAERARTELRGTGETARRGERRAEHHLTAQELQVALTIAGGATNREAAAALFLSPKTIEYHLTHIYAKLGLRSRSELARRFAREIEPG
jgi:DNA-binding CsgD family transcriptional regulator